MSYKIYLYDTDQDCIGSGTLSSSYIQYQLETAAGQDVEVHISSVGGSAFDNAYPQRMLELVAGSPTAKDCWNKRAKFIAGNGFEQKDLGKQIINPHGLTIAKLLKAVASDKALFTGFGIHVNYNANFKIASVNYFKFEDIRMDDTDDPTTANKYAIYSDWGQYSRFGHYLQKPW